MKIEIEVTAEQVLDEARRAARELVTKEIRKLFEPVYGGPKDQPIGVQRIRQAVSEAIQTIDFKHLAEVAVGGCLPKAIAKAAEEKALHVARGEAYRAARKALKVPFVKRA